MDQQEIESLLSGDTPQYGAVTAVYENGAHSKSYAVLSVPSGLPTSAVKGTAVIGKAINGADITGKIYENASSGATTVKVQYDTSDDHATYVGCQVGGSSSPVTDGCFAASGNLDFGGSSIAYNSVENMNGRTIKGFSTSTDSHRVNGSGEFYQDFDMFQEYYGTTSYADEWVSAALSQTRTQFTNGNANFAPSEDEARIRKLVRIVARKNSRFCPAKINLLTPLSFRPILQRPSRREPLT